MRTFALMTILGLFLAAPAAGLAEEGARWFDDFDKAAAAAKAEGKDLFVDFTGSDWCGWCHKLDDEVFKHEEFIKPAMDKFVLVALDFPRDPAVKAKVPNPDRNEELRKKYNVSGFPTVLLMTAEGEVYGRSGYRPGGPAKYVEFLNELQVKGKDALAAVKAIVAEYEAADAEKKPGVLDAAAAKLGEMERDAAGRESLGELVKKLLFDESAAAERRVAAAKALLDSGQADAEVLKAAHALDPKNGSGLLERVALAECYQVKSADQVGGAFKGLVEVDAMGIKDPEVKKEIYWVATVMNTPRYLNDPATAKKYAQKALDAGVDDPRRVQMLKQLVGS